jgi:hypothetical protein
MDSKLPYWTYGENVPTVVVLVTSFECYERFQVMFVIDTMDVIGICKIHKEEEQMV